MLFKIYVSKKMLDCIFLFTEETSLIIGVRLEEFIYVLFELIFSYKYF